MVKRYTFVTLQAKAALLIGAGLGLTYAGISLNPGPDDDIQARNFIIVGVVCLLIGGLLAWYARRKEVKQVSHANLQDLLKGKK